MDSDGNRPTASDHSLLADYRGGDQAAAAELYLRYAQRLRGLARAQLSPGLSRQVDVDDIVQSVFGSFFRGVSDAFYDVPAGEELWKLLLVIALNKIRKKAAYHHAARRDARRTSTGDPALDALVAEDREACRFLELVVAEALQAMTPMHRGVVELRMQGWEVSQIAQQLKRSKRTVERLLQQACSRLSALLEEGDAT